MNVTFYTTRNKIKSIFGKLFSKANLTLSAINYLQEFDINVVQVLIEDKTTVLNLEHLTVISEEINELGL
ncbi:MAG: hypothetical protein OHM56_00500 [Spiroplasma phoeniceum]|nr:MAG: hypothetical protein OHM57_13015 [Spiroplasma phoeniceum]UZQ32502.1 MAG: hypothetical protein OHM56_00500 [Spiroplasma phoeniceum]